MFIIAAEVYPLSPPIGSSFTLGPYPRVSRLPPYPLVPESIFSFFPSPLSKTRSFEDVLSQQVFLQSNLLMSVDDRRQHSTKNAFKMPGSNVLTYCSVEEWQRVQRAVREEPHKCGFGEYKKRAELICQ